MRIALAIWGMFTSRGGLERMGAHLANAMSLRGHSVTIFYAGRPGNASPVFPVDEAVTYLPLELGNSEEFARTRARILENDPHVFCGLFSHSPLMFFPALLNGTGVPFLVSEHNDPRLIESERWNAYEHRACLYAADAVHVLNEGFRALLPDFLQKN